MIITWVGALVLLSQLLIWPDLVHCTRPPIVHLMQDGKGLDW